MNVYVSNIVVLMSPHYSFDGQSNDGYDGASKTQGEQRLLKQNDNINTGKVKMKQKGKYVVLLMSIKSI